MAQTDTMIPTDFLALLTAQYGETLTTDILTGYAQTRPVTLRFNPVKISAEEGKRRLADAGISFQEVPWYQDALILNGVCEAQIQALPLYEEGAIYLQSLSSMLPPLFLEPKAGESILDMTAAPGGKTTELYALSGGKALVTACERDKIRFERMKYNLEKQGASRVSALCIDASTLDDAFSFDKILLDAPCSGSGTVFADAPVRLSKTYVEKCARAQEKLLKKALKLLKKGGTMIYSTCSILAQENDHIVSACLKGSDCELVPVQPFEGLPLLLSMEGTLCVKPTELYEGFFLAKIKKR